MNSFKTIKQISSWAVFAIAMVVYYLSAERTGSLWDCGEFILGAHKLEVVHPPGAPLFLIVGRFFTWFASIISDDPANIAFAVNLMSGMCTAFCAFFVARVTMLFGKIGMVGRSEEPTQGQNVALGFAGLVAGLSTAFCSSIWFSAVEGEVYAMSTMFTAVTFWSAVKWYSLPKDPKHDRWLVLTAYLGGLSIGVHLLSLLTFPAVGLMYYFKKYEKTTFLGVILSFIAGASIIAFVQKVVIVGIPSLWQFFEIPLVNSFGLPFHSGAVLAFLVIAICTWLLLRFTHRNGYRTLNMLTMGAVMIMIGFSTIGVIVIRANADTPVNMNVPSDAIRLLPYLNREQYGERPLLFGPHFKAKPKELAREDRYGRVGDRYEIVDEKLDYVFDGKDKMFLPRIGHNDGPRQELHANWYQYIYNKELKGIPGYGYNIQYMLKYQMGWMYWRYFMWNFSGRQNGAQGYYKWDVSDGNWLSGIKPIDEARLHNMSQLTDRMENHKAYNKYYMLPFLFGLIGLFFCFFQDKKNFMVLMTLFLITGLGIIMYSNQPPNEPRERDYVLAGSFFTYCVWIGLSVLAIFQLLVNKMNLKGIAPAGLAGLLILIAPVIMGLENFDDHSRRHNYGSRDYAANFLNSVDENAIIFTYGDNDTYPLWYAQEVENIRRDVRVVNLSLIAVDWYIEKLRNKVNDSAPLKLSIPSKAYLGKNRNQVFYYNRANPQQPNDAITPTNVFEEMSRIADDKYTIDDQTIMSSRKLFIPIDRNRMAQNGITFPADSNSVDRINITLPARGYIQKDELAVMDVVASNIHERPIYFAVTCKNEKLLSMNNFTQLEGLGLRIIPEYNKSIKGLSIYGSGKVELDKAYNNIMTKWAWGNFDKVETFIDDSYAAELQAMRIVMMRTAQELLDTGQNQKAINLCKKYFEAFPHFNFPYEEQVGPFIEIMIDAGEKTEAIKHTRLLANDLSQRFDFYDSLDDYAFESYKQDFSYAIKSVSDVLEYSKKINDPAFKNEMEQLLSEYDYSKLKNKK